MLKAQPLDFLQDFSGDPEVCSYKNSHFSHWFVCIIIVEQKCRGPAYYRQSHTSAAQIWLKCLNVIFLFFWFFDHLGAVQTNYEEHIQQIWGHISLCPSNGFKTIISFCCFWSAAIDVSWNHLMCNLDLQACFTADSCREITDSSRVRGNQRVWCKCLFLST